MSRNKARVCYEIIEHTADIGLRVFGKNLREIFTHAAAGMFFIMSGKRSNAGTLEQSRQTFMITLTAQNQEELLVSWLSELLALSDIHCALFTYFDIRQLTDTAITAQARAQAMGSAALRGTAIKAITYHQLAIRPLPEGRLQAEIIFDV